MSGFTRRRHVILVGRPLVCDDAWRELYTVVTQGTVEVRTTYGARLRLVPGDVLCLARVGPATLVAVGPDDVVVTAIHRNVPDPDLT